MKRGRQNQQRAKNNIWIRLCFTAGRYHIDCPSTRKDRRRLGLNVQISTCTKTFSMRVSGTVDELERG